MVGVIGFFMALTSFLVLSSFFNAVFFWLGSDLSNLLFGGTFKASSALSSSSLRRSLSSGLLSWSLPSKRKNCKNNRVGFIRFNGLFAEGLTGRLKLEVRLLSNIFARLFQNTLY